MSGKQTKPKPKRFKCRNQRDRYFRALGYRTDKRARHNRELWALDEARIMAALPSPPVQQRAER